ncbi:hypothetical protein [Gemmobacter denitrificans]|uniref:Extracellular solute-binding protein n=1 Tax=Gemmobacter denitrificans TaxID=3123040 RepID=A0ABU8C0X8_9RHOB
MRLLPTYLPGQLRRNLTSEICAVTMALLATGALPAEAEGALNIHNFGLYTPPDLIEKFEKTHDVKGTLTEYDSNETALANVAPEWAKDRSRTDPRVWGTMGMMVNRDVYAGDINTAASFLDPPKELKGNGIVGSGAFLTADLLAGSPMTSRPCLRSGDRNQRIIR